MTKKSRDDKAPVLPGLLSDPKRVLRDDERVDPRILEVLKPFDLDGLPAEPPVDGSAPIEDLRSFCSDVEGGFEAFFEAILSTATPVEGVERSSQIIKGTEGHEISIYIHRPKNVSQEIPCVYHIHGGGMVMLQANKPAYNHWRDYLSSFGMVVVGVEFRNGAGVLGDHPFPAGLDDCMAGLDWAFDNKSALGISKIIISGESGGGNLSLALTLRAKKEGKLNKIQGTYALCPYIYGDYGNKTKNLPSLYENDGYFLLVKTMDALAAVYDPDRQNARNPLCWPYQATVEDLRGLPPHCISVNELDPLRDEGLAYFRKLAQAGVNVYSRTVNGTVHAADVLFVESIPEMSNSTARDIAGFAHRV